MENDQDWRLTGQEVYLKGKILQRKIYIPPRTDWDHDHCSFCWKKFMVKEAPDTIQEGFVTEDNQHWICPQCFSDFQDEFQWTINKQ